jgi:tetratricopeptide (TPR) repeat protein
MNNISKENDLAFQIRFYERLVADKADFADALIPLAQAYTDAKEYKKGLLIDKRLSRLKPYDATVFYNLACSFALLNMTDEALQALHKSIKLGYSDISHLLTDRDLDSLRTDPRFSRLTAIIQKESRL